MSRLAHLGLMTALVSAVSSSSALGEQALIRKRTALERPDSHGGFLAFAFSPDGKTIAGGTGVVTVSSGNRQLRLGGEILLWNAATGKLKTLGRHGDSVGHVAFSNDGRTLVSASRANGTIKVWQMPAGRLLHTLQIDAEEKSTDLRWPQLAISDNGQTLVTINSRRIPLGEDSHVATGGTLTVWDIQSGEKRWSREESDAHAAALSPDGTRLVTAQRAVTDMRTDDRGRTRFRTQHALQSWNATTGEVLHTADLGPTATPDQIVLLDDDTVVMFTGVGLSMRDRRSGQPGHEIKWSDDRSSGEAQLSSDGKTVGRSDRGWIEIVDVATGKLRGLLTTEFPNHLSSIAFSNDLRRAAAQVSGRDGGPVLLDLILEPAPLPEEAGERNADGNVQFLQ